MSIFVSIFLNFINFDSCTSKACVLIPLFFKNYNLDPCSQNFNTNFILYKNYLTQNHDSISKRLLIILWIEIVIEKKKCD